MLVHEMVKVTFSEEISKSATKYDMNMEWSTITMDANNPSYHVNTEKGTTNTTSTNSRKSLANPKYPITVSSLKYGWMVRVVAGLKK